MNQLPRRGTIARDYMELYVAVRRLGRALYVGFLPVLRVVARAIDR